MSFHEEVANNQRNSCIFDLRSIGGSVSPPEGLEAEEIAVEGEEHQRNSTSSESSREGKSCQEKINELSKARCTYWVNIILLLSFTSLCIAMGSVDRDEVRNGLKIGEQICQGIFLLLLVIKILSQQ